MRATIIPVTAFAQNCSVIWCEQTGAGAVIDPGGDLDQVLATVREENVRLEKILLTHAHIDHAGGTAELARTLKLPIEGPHRGDQFWIDGLPEQSRMFGLPKSDTFTARGTRPATSCSTTRRTGSHSSATYCSQARSDARIFRAAITRL